MNNMITATGIKFLRALAEPERTAVDKCIDYDYASITDDDLRVCEFMTPERAVYRRQLQKNIAVVHACAAREHATIH